LSFHVTAGASDNITVSLNKNADMLMRESAHSGEDSKLNSPDDGETSLSSILATTHNQNPELTRLSSENTTQASEEPASPQPWEPLRLPDMNTIETFASRAIVPDSRVMKIFQAPHVTQMLDDSKIQSIPERERMWLSSSRGTQATETKTALAKSTFKPREDEPEDEKSHGHLSTSAVSHILETDDDMALAEALGLYRSKSNVLADPIHPDIG
jgi:hypothetical protein